MAQDALYDAEEYLRSELAEHPEWDEATMLANVATSYGAPEEVAEIYRDKETQVENALRPPAAPPRRFADRQILCGICRSAGVFVAVLHAAVAGDRHFLFHLGDHRPEPVARACAS